MAYHGDYAEDTQYLDFTFTTNSSSGTPAALGGTAALTIYKQNITSGITTGLTLSTDFAGHIKALDILGDALCVEFSGRPSCQHAHTFSL